MIRGMTDDMSQYIFEEKQMLPQGDQSFLRQYRASGRGFALLSDRRRSQKSSNMQKESKR